MSSKCISIVFTSPHGMDAQQALLVTSIFCSPVDASVHRLNRWCTSENIGWIFAQSRVSCAFELASVSSSFPSITICKKKHHFTLWQNHQKLTLKAAFWRNYIKIETGSKINIRIIEKTQYTLNFYWLHESRFRCYFGRDIDLNCAFCSWIGCGWPLP